MSRLSEEDGKDALLKEQGKQGVKIDEVRT